MACGWWEGGCILLRQDPEVGSLSATLRREQGLASSPLLVGVPELPKFSAWGLPWGDLKSGSRHKEPIVLGSVVGGTWVVQRSPPRMGPVCLPCGLRGHLPHELWPFLGFWLTLGPLVFSRTLIGKAVPVLGYMGPNCKGQPGGTPCGMSQGPVTQWALGVLPELEMRRLAAWAGPNVLQ